MRSARVHTVSDDDEPSLTDVKIAQPKAYDDIVALADALNRPMVNV
jgi:hypothetical protein